MKKILLKLSIVFFVMCFAHLRAQTNIYTQNFEGGVMPTGWTQKIPTGDSLGWQFGDSASMSSIPVTITDFKIPSHTIFACTSSDKCQCDKSNDMLITPVFNFDTLTGKTIQLSFDEFYYGYAYTDGSGIQESAVIKASTDKGKTWSVVDSILPMGRWFNQIVDLSSFAGDSVMLAFVYDDMDEASTHPLRGLAIDNVNIEIPLDYDVACMNINLPQCFRQGVSRSIEAQLYSRCNDIITIDSVSINYQVGSGSIVTEKLNNLDIAPGKFGSFTFSTAWNPPVGVQTLKVWVSKINGHADQNHSNDTAEVTLNVYKAGKPVLVEYFTEMTAYWCGVYDPILQKTVAQDSDFVIPIAYHTRFNGIDPDPLNNSANTADCVNRLNFYGLPALPSSLPTAYTDGTISPNLMYDGSECDLASSTEKDTTFEINNIKVNLKCSGELSYSADIVAKKSISGSIKGYVAVIENNIKYLLHGEDGENCFPWVLKKMCPTGNGTDLSLPMNTGDKQTLSGNWTLSDIRSNTELSVIFFVQNTSTKEVYWAALYPVNNLNTFPEQICYVEFDTTTSKNSIVWPNLTLKLDSVHIYNQTSTNNWKRRGSVSARKHNFIDTLSNPFNQSYTYTISVKDTCGYETDSSTAHTTITLLAVYDRGTNTYGFTWSPYIGLAMITNYYIYGVKANGQDTVIGFVPGTMYFYNYTNPNLSLKKYFVGFGTPPCGEKANHIVRSNYVSGTTGIKENAGIDNMVSLYPNPANDIVTIDFKGYSGKEKTVIELYNITGGLIKTQVIQSTLTQVNISDLAEGVYIVKVMNENGVAVAKFIKE